MLTKVMLGSLTPWRLGGFGDFRKKTAVFGCLTNALAPPPIALEQWFSNCGTRTTSGTRGLFRWYASSFPVIFEKLC